MHDPKTLNKLNRERAIELNRQKRQALDVQSSILLVKFLPTR